MRVLYGGSSAVVCFFTREWRRKKDILCLAILNVNLLEYGFDVAHTLALVGFKKNTYP